MGKIALWWEIVGRFGPARFACNRLFFIEEQGFAVAKKRHIGRSSAARDGRRRQFVFDRDEVLLDVVGGLAQEVHQLVDVVDERVDMTPQMLQAWRDMGEPTYPYSKEQIRQLLDARKYRYQARAVPKNE